MDFDHFTARLGAALLQLAQDHDLRRLERDPAQHHRQDDAGPVGRAMNFDYSEEQQLLADSVRALPGERLRASRRARRSSPRPRAGARRSWAHLRRDGPARRCRFAGGARRLRRRRGRPDVRDGGLRRGAGGRAVPGHGRARRAARRARAARRPSRQRILPALVEGQHRLAFAHTEPGARYEPAPRGRRAPGAADPATCWRARSARCSTARGRTRWSSRAHVGRRHRSGGHQPVPRRPATRPA